MSERIPVCPECSRQEPLWSSCGRPRIDCPQWIAEPGKAPIRIITVTEPGYDVVLFFNEDGGAEAVISRPGDQQPMGVNIAPPMPGRRIVVARTGDKFEVTYKDAP